jgi:enoyl-CoA hydratase/carnithine racemase
MGAESSFASGRIGAVVTPDKIGRLTINRPDKRNALTDAMWRALPTALEWFTSEQTARVIIIEGAGGRDFSAGADIGEFATLRKDAVTARIYEAGNSAAFAAVRTCPVPVIAAIRGICFGGGFGIAAAADIRIGDDTARFAIPAARLGLAYPLDAIQDLVRTLGDQARAACAVFNASSFPLLRQRRMAVCSRSAGRMHWRRKSMRLARAIANRRADLGRRVQRPPSMPRTSHSNDDLTRAAGLADATFDSRDYAEEGPPSWRSGLLCSPAIKQFQRKRDAVSHQELQKNR